jgi:hypothetical protein
MSGLELAMSEVRRKLKTPFNVVWLFLCNSTALKLNRHTQQVLASGGHGVTPLQ